jgi:16S rRNA (cytosine967-C5)-methyltransferase
MSRNRGASPEAPAATRNRRPMPHRTRHDNVRSAAGWVIDRTLRSLAPVDSFLTTTQSRFDERDQGLLRELVMGTLRWLRRIDDIIGQASDRWFEDIEPELRSPLRLATYQLLFLDRVPPHAAVHEAVDEARVLTHRGGASFVNGVLRRIARSPRLEEWPVEESDPMRRLARELSHPDYLVERWWHRLGAERTASLLTANNRDKPLQVLAFRDRGGRELLAESLIDDGCEVEPTVFSPLGLTVRRGSPLAASSFARGDFYIQDEASQAAALIPPPRKGERVLDAAAAPGGKTFSLLSREPSLAPLMSDVSFGRLMRLRANLRRLRRPLPIFVADAAVPALRDETYDRVVLDLPCTGTGTLRRHPELKWRISAGEIGRLSADALRLLHGAAPLVRAGGLLVAITCSLEEEENEAVAQTFLKAASQFTSFDLEPHLTGLQSQCIVGPGCWRVLTGGDHDGFSVNVFVKSGDGRSAL